MQRRAVGAVLPREQLTPEIINLCRLSAARLSLDQRDAVALDGVDELQVKLVKSNKLHEQHNYNREK